MQVGDYIKYRRRPSDLYGLSKSSFMSDVLEQECEIIEFLFDKVRIKCPNGKLWYTNIEKESDYTIISKGTINVGKKSKSREYSGDGWEVAIAGREICGIRNKRIDPYHEVNYSHSKVDRGWYSYLDKPLKDFRDCPYPHGFTYEQLIAHAEACLNSGTFIDPNRYKDPVDNYFTKDSYYVIIADEGTTLNFKKNYIYKCRESSDILRVHKDCSGHENGWRQSGSQYSHNTRLARTEEIEMYADAGKPVDVSTYKLKSPEQFFNTGEYIVTTWQAKPNKATDSSFPKDHIFKVARKSSIFHSVLDCNGSTSNGWSLLNFKDGKDNWRYATKEEIEAYDRAGKPVHISSLYSKPEEPKLSYKFKVGDKVRIINNGSGVSGDHRGSIVTIKSLGKYENSFGLQPGYEISRFCVNGRSITSNSKTGHHDSMCGENSFEDISHLPWRYKTEQEFTSQYGDGWQRKVDYTWNNPNMNHLFGQPCPLKYLGEDEGKWSISTDMVTTDPLPTSQTVETTTKELEDSFAHFDAISDEDPSKFQENYAYECKSKEESIALLELATTKGYTWADGRPFSSRNLWDDTTESICYSIIRGTYGHRKSFGPSYTVVQASEILKANKISVNTYKYSGLETPPELEIKLPKEY